MLKLKLCVLLSLMGNLYGMDSSSATCQVYSALYRYAHDEIRPWVAQKLVIQGNPYLLHDYLDNKLQKKEKYSFPMVKLLLEAGINPYLKNKKNEDAFAIVRKFGDTKIEKQFVDMIDLYGCGSN